VRVGRSRSASLALLADTCWPTLLYSSGQASFCLRGAVVRTAADYGRVKPTLGSLSPITGLLAVCL
jgi:hypothetical protein